MKQLGKGRLRVFFAEFEGSDDTMQEGLRSIAHAVSRTFQARTQIQRPMLDSSATESQEQVELRDGDEETEDVALDLTPPKREARRMKAPTLSIVKDLNLRPEGKIPLRDFFAEKSPQNLQQMVVVFLYYLQRTLELTAVTPHHVFTCFKDVEKRPPRDLAQTIRNTASRRGWIDSSSQSDIKITNHGENFVEHDLPGPEKAR